MQRLRMSLAAGVRPGQTCAATELLFGRKADGRQRDGGIGFRSSTVAGARNRFVVVPASAIGRQEAYFGAWVGLRPCASTPFALRT